MTSPSDPSQPAVKAFATIDLGASADETAGQATGRRIGGAVLMVVAGVLTIASLLMWVVGWAIPGFLGWYEAIGDVFPFLAVVFFILTALGFELLRRARKRKGEVTPQATALMGALDIVDRLDGADDPEPTLNATPDSAAFGPGVTGTAKEGDDPKPGPLTTETRL